MPSVSGQKIKRLCRDQARPRQSDHPTGQLGAAPITGNRRGLTAWRVAASIRTFIISCVGGPRNSLTYKSTMLTELLAFLDELLSYVESVRDFRDEDGRSARRSPEIEHLT
jgi:hypothetical protein